MDDRNFDKKSADEWIAIIESKAAAVRSQDLYPKVENWLRTSSAKTTLEIGCGQGDCPLKIDLKDIEYIGVDPSPFLIERAKELNPETSERFSLGNAYALPFENSHFDSVFSVGLWHLLENLELACAEMARVLKPKGSFLIVTANPEQYKIFKNAYHSFKLEDKRLTGEKMHSDDSKSQDILYLHSLDDIESALKQHGLEINSKEIIRHFLVLEGSKI